MVAQSKKSGGGPSKKPPAAGPSTGDDSYIVFSNAKGEPKAKNVEGKSVLQKGAVSASNEEDAPKKLDTRALIGGASWTGKLPVNLLSEHCQKQKWEKPEYTMNKSSSGFSSSVILKAVHPKTKETLILPPFHLPLSHARLALAPTAVEARHFAATYTLFRVSSMKNVHMMLPPTYRDLWKKEFTMLKEADLKEGRGWMYESDPFAAKLERDEAQALMAKQKEAAEKLRATGTSQLGSQGNSKGAGVNKSGRGWTNVPTVDMGKSLRTSVEALIREHAVWNPNQTRLSEFQRRNLIIELVDLGFRRSHIEEASDICKDREEVIEWLLIHVPEDDLPEWSLPEGYVAGITMASGNMKRDASIKRLADAGYSIELCQKVLDEHGGSEGAAAEALQNLLVPEADHGAGLQLSNLDLEATHGSSVWQEEQETLESIFLERYSRNTDDICEIVLEVGQSMIRHTLSVRKSKLYPSTPPVVSIAPGGGLPSYIRLSIYRQLIEFARETLLQAPMIFNLVDWLENEIPRVVENPGKLLDIAAAASTISEARPKSVIPIYHLSQHFPRPIEWNKHSSESLTILRGWQSRQNNQRYQKMLAIRQALPAWSVRNDIVDTVNAHQVTIISGETGSGKSTQSVQFILDDMIQQQLGAVANIICTQPRRISALGLADRVCEERCATLGEEVGYAIRGDSKQRQGITKITFVTTGVLLRRLQSSGGSMENVVLSIADVSHVFVDEVHERSLDTDFLLILLKSVLRKRKDLKVILMSATLNASVFEEYFSTVSSVGRIEIEGRTFPVDDYYLDDVIRMTGFNPAARRGEDDRDIEEESMAGIIQNIGMRINYNLIAAAVEAIDAQLGSVEGGILIFLPGVVEINKTIDALRHMGKIYALPLNASLTPAEQRMVFPPPPRGRRKVVAATNVAETSITIEDIVAIIDTGKVKETAFDPINNIVKLEEVWASRAACKQRKGRAGRVRAGKCYKLYTQNAENKMAERPEPEIRRVPLEQLCLSVRAMGIVDVSSFLGSAITPPDTMAIASAIQLLQRLGALDGQDLTALGRHLSLIPADLRCGKLMVLGALFGCLDASLTIASILTVRSPFLSPQGKRDEAKAARTSFAANQGDLLADMYVYDEWSRLRATSPNREVRSWCDINFLSHQTLIDISTNRVQYCTSLADAGFVTPSYSRNGGIDPAAKALNANGSSPALIRALIAAAFNPQLARIDFPSTKYAASVSGAVALDPEAKTIKFFTQDAGRVFVHPSSTLFSAQSFVNNSVFLSYFTKMETSKVFIRDLTPFNCFSLLMFGGPIGLDTLGRGILVDGWIRIRGWARIGVLVGRLRSMLDAVLARRIEHPGGLEYQGTHGDQAIVNVVGRLVELDGMDR